jgi:MoaA/NifB/PqqE/SkfB family radical SAM enzyme
LLREDLIEVIAAARPRKCFLTLATNGIALTISKAVQIREAGIRMVSLSLDAPEAEKHDQERGYPGCYQKAMQAIDSALSAGLKVSVCCILTRDLLQSGRILTLIDQIKGKVQQVTLNLPYRVGGWAGHDERLTEEELLMFRKLVSRPFVRWQGSSNYLREGCPAGGEKIYITPYGDVMPCACIHASYGNLRERSLQEIYKEMRQTPIFRQGIHGLCLVAEDPVFSSTYMDAINALAKKDPSGQEGKALLNRIAPHEIS